MTSTANVHENHCITRTEKVGGVVAGIRDGKAHGFKVRQTALCSAKVDELSLCQQQQLIEKPENIGARLMNRHDDGRPMRSSQPRQRLHHHVRIIRIQPNINFEMIITRL
jgi:hypothetical protein